jgi:uncharacterized protein (TIGR03437 family)
MIRLPENCKGSQWPVWLAVLACLCMTAPEVRAQRAADMARSEWFFGQRRFGLGYIPDDALAKAVAARGARSSTKGIAIAALSDSAALGDGTAGITQGHWTSFGPAGMNSTLNDLVSGRVNSLAPDPLHRGTVYLGAAGGGVWKSTNRGAQWTPLTDGLPSLSSGAVAVDPFSGDVWYGTGELNFCLDCYYGAGVYRSSDGGSNWTRINATNFLSSPTSLIVFDPRNRGTLFIGRSTALWKSTDGGASWHVVLRGAITDFEISPTDSTVAYAAIGYYSGSADNGVYRSADGGETWSRLSGGLPDQTTIGRVAIAAAPSSPTTLYALIANSSDFKLNGLYRSLNGGAAWSRMNKLPPDIMTEDGAGQGAFNICLQVDPNNAAVVYAGGSDLWKSTDFGVNWQSLSVSAGLHEDPHEIIYDPFDHSTFYLIGDSGAWRSSDGGGSFVDLNLTLAVTQFESIGLHPSNPSLAAAGTQDNGTTLYSGGALWDQGRPGDAGATFFDAANPRTIYSLARYLSVRRSDDGGQTFSLVANGLDGSDRVLYYPPLVQDPGRPGILYLGSYRMWQSVDRGNNWSPISDDITASSTAMLSAIAVAPTSSLVVYAGTSEGLVRVSQDGGHAWSTAAPIPSRFVTSIAVDPRAPQAAVVGVSGFGSGHVFRTANFGASWEDLSRNLPDIPVNAVLLDVSAPDTIYLGTDIGVFVLGQDGNWAPLQDGLPNAVVLSLAQNATTKALFAATHGRGVFALSPSATASTLPRLDGVTNVASFEAVPLAPGMVASLFGANLAATTAISGNVPLPTSLGGATLLINGIAVPLFFASAQQINFQVPFDLTGPFAELRIRTSQGEVYMHMPRRDASPGIYQNGGVGLIVHGNGAPVTLSAPALRGEEVVMYVSGLGTVTPSVANGSSAPFSPSFASTTASPLVRVGGIVAETRFSGLTPGYVGLYQMNFVIPNGVSGTTSLAIESGGVVNGAVSNAVTVSVAP